MAFANVLNFHIIRARPSSSSKIIFGAVSTVYTKKCICSVEMNHPGTIYLGSRQSIMDLVLCPFRTRCSSWSCPGWPSRPKADMSESQPRFTRPPPSLRRSLWRKTQTIPATKCSGHYHRRQKNKIDSVFCLISKESVFLKINNFKLKLFWRVVSAGLTLTLIVENFVYGFRQLCLESFA